jgi:hypothetical protein
MNKLITSIIALSLLITSCNAQTKTASFEPIAVVELFTSEGCSSCPPADALLSKYDLDATYHGVKVFPLAFHVDYWNYIGWKDSFSSTQYSDRQRMYVDALGLSGAYTPQLIVNGKTQFVGSEETTLQTSLAAASHLKSLAAFSALHTINESGKLKVSYSLQGDFKNSDIHFALVSLHVSTFVKRGENSGRKLSHTNVVRQFITQPAQASGEATFPSGTALSDNTAIIAYVQKSVDHSIIAAAKTK